MTPINNAIVTRNATPGRRSPPERPASGLALDDPRGEERDERQTGPRQNTGRAIP
jgi:hypothetical protein